jgi:glutathione S-transferase
MLTLYDYLPSQNGWKIRTLLEILDIPYRIRPVAIFSGESRRPEFLAKNPAGAIPALELEDGRTIAESNAILCYLGQGTPLLPADPYSHAKTLQWLFFEQYYVEPTLGTLRFWALTGRLDANAPLVPGKRDNAARALAGMQFALSQTPYFVGERFTIADLAIYAYAHLMADAGFDAAAYPAVARWFERVALEIGPGHPVHPYGDEARLK